MEYVYKLNLPGLIDVVKDDLKLDPFGGYKKPNHVYSVPIKNFLHPNWTNINNLDWFHLSIFNKPPGSFGIIHNDTRDTSQFYWSINWVYGEGGGMCFWEENQIYQRTVDKDVAGLYRTVFKVNSPPSKKYKTEHNGVYLVNSTKIHNAYNYSKEGKTRYAVAIKARPTPQINTWEKVVNIFQSYIIQ